MRRPLVAGNWKLHGTLAEAERLASGVRWALAGEPPPVDVVLCPPFTALKTVGDVLDGSQMALGAQDLHWETSGAFTGEVSAAMLADVGCRYAIVGHSERRALFGETDGDVRRKTAATLAAGLCPIVCVGETLAEREAGSTDAVIERQLRGALDGLEAEPGPLAVAYEPVWAIGTGRTASPRQAQQAHARLRTVLGELAGGRAAGGVRILYGGSVKPANAKELFAGEDVDGGLIGGASLEIDGFVAIVRAAAPPPPRS